MSSSKLWSDMDVSWMSVVASRKSASAISKHGGVRMRGWLHPCTSLEREDRREGLAETGSLTTLRALCADEDPGPMLLTREPTET